MAASMQAAQAASPAPGRIMVALDAQRGFMNRYGDSLEQLLSVGVYLIPVSDDDDDAAGFNSQAVYSIIDLFNLYRTVILRSPDALPVVVAQDRDSTTPGTAMTTSGPELQRARIQYTIAAFVLRSLRAVQVLIEMYAHRASGPRHALRICIRIEVVKLVLKMFLRSRMPFSFYVDEDALEEVEPPKKSQSQTPAVHAEDADDAVGVAATAVADIAAGAAASAFGVPDIGTGAVGGAAGEGVATDASAGEGTPPRLEQSPEVGPRIDANVAAGTSEPVVDAYVGSRSGRTLPALGAANSSAASASDNVAADDAPSAAPPTIVGICDHRTANSPGIVAAEVLYHSRPLLHLLMLLRHGGKSWAVWWFTVFLDRLAYSVLAQELRAKVGTRAAALESAELKRRNNLAWWALMRSPCFERFFQSKAEAVDRVIKRIPIINIFNFMELFLALQPFYFTTSAS